MTEPGPLRGLTLLAARELRLSLSRPGSWLLLGAYLLLAGLFYALRLAAGEGGDQGGLLRELGAVLVPLAALHGGPALAEGPRALGYRQGPFAAWQVALAGALPALGWASACGLVGGFLPLLLYAYQPVDPGRLLAGGLALASLGAAVAALAVGAGALLGHGGAGALAGFALGLGLFGAGGLAEATGVRSLGLLDLSAPLLAGGIGWVSLPTLAPALTVAISALVLAATAWEARRW